LARGPHSTGHKISVPGPL